ncbi:unnamed protein product [Citrullus colocynthis]|uniref:PGG domain-containing protein n=1 Tax=Citrullus colocynthis TaxID=252529 RepID=A0ABP0Y342_9ROSI
MEVYKGLHQVLARKPIISNNHDDNKNSDVVVDEKQKSVEIREVKTKAIGDHRILSDYIGCDWSNATVVATIIATATYNASYQIPSGYDNKGMAVLQQEEDFKQYLTNNMKFKFYLLIAVSIPIGVFSESIEHIFIQCPFTAVLWEETLGYSHPLYNG